MGRNAILIGTLFLCGLLSGCNNSSGGSTSSAAPAAAPTHSFDYVLSSSDGNMSVGSKVIYVWAPSSTPCASAGTYSNDFAGTVTIANQLRVTYSHQRTTPYIESVYIDTDASGTLTEGDMVFGTEPTQMAGACVTPSSTSDSLTTNQTWEYMAFTAGGGYRRWRPQPAVTIKYEVIGSGCSPDISYNNATGGLNSVSAQGLPWSTSLSVTPTGSVGFYASVFALTPFACNSPNITYTANIYTDGSLFTTSTSSGPHPFVRASGFIQ